MQNEQTLEQMIKEYEANMPPEIMSLIKSFDWKREVRMVVNQNQLMIDVGADLEQSIYLMILGAVKVEDLYERLMDIHELPADKAQKIIQEIETQIFNPLHKKLTTLDSSEEASPAPIIPVGVSETQIRDDMLAEIEKDEEPINQEEIVIKNIPLTKEVEIGDKGIVQPFTISSSTEVEVQPTPIPALSVVEGAQEDPVSAGLQNQTVTQAQPVQAPVKSYVADPYREPLE